VVINREHVDAPACRVPRLERSLQRDPIGILGGANVYEYGTGSPGGFVDPDGLASSLLHPEGVVALVETEIATSGSATVTINGTSHVVTDVIVTTAGSSKTATMVTATGRHVLTWTWRVGQRIGRGNKVIQTSCGVVIETGGACGVTGVEAVPFIVLCCWLTSRRRRRARSAANNR
jgi:hypothetical protein